MQAQLKKARNEVREMARRLGVDYVIWDHVREMMTNNRLDRVELAEFLAHCVVEKSWIMLGLVRYRVVSADPNERIAGATISLHREILTIEVMSLQIEEDKQ